MGHRGKPHSYDSSLLRGFVASWLRVSQNNLYGLYLGVSLSAWGQLQEKALEVLRLRHAEQDRVIG